jgi:hypothetical protein
VHVSAAIKIKMVHNNTNLPPNDLIDDIKIEWGVLPISLTARVAANRVSIV